MKIVGTAIIIDDENRILIGQRPEGKALAGLWEFPGGKQEPGETIEQCIVREIKEELDASCVVGKFLMSVSKQYEHGDFKLMVYEAKINDKENITPKVHQKLCWVMPRDMDKYEFPAADEEIIKFIQEKY